MDKNWVRVEGIDDYTLESLGEQEVLGFNKLWVNEKFNPKGIRICFYSNTDLTDSGWCSANWVDNQVMYQADSLSIPTYICLIPDTKNLQ